MGGGAETRRPSAIACALSAVCALSFAATGGARATTPLAAELGPQVTLTEPANGYVGRIAVAPGHGPVGTPVTVSGQGLPPGQDFELVWRTVNGSWKVGDGEYHGREFTPVAYRIT